MHISQVCYHELASKTRCLACRFLFFFMTFDL